MKRVWIVCFIVAGILGLSVAALVHLNMVTHEMEASLENLSAAVDSGDHAKTVELADAFHREWEDNEEEMLRYIHHDELDSITGCVARLPALAKYDDYAELGAEIERLKHLIKHIHEAEMPTLANIM